MVEVYQEVVNKTINNTDKLYKTKSNEYIKIRLLDEPASVSKGILKIIKISGSLTDKNGNALLIKDMTKTKINAIKKKENITKSPPEYYLINQTKVITIQQMSNVSYDVVNSINTLIQEHISDTIEVFRNVNNIDKFLINWRK